MTIAAGAWSLRQRLEEMRARPAPLPEPPRAAPPEPIVAPPAAPRRGFFVSVDEGCNFLGVECFGGLTEGDYALLCFASAHTYAAHAYRAAVALTQAKGAADGGESAD
jgi:hypothetical protein